jgi:hypothetical protein
MKSIAFKWRLILRKILTALLATVPFSLGACATPDYGVPGTTITGTVIGNGEPVSGIKASIKNDYSYTNEDGEFHIFVTETESQPYTVLFEDVDGPLNGEFNSKTVQYTRGTVPWYIVLEPKQMSN